MDANIAQKSADLGTRTSNGESTALSLSFLSTSSLDFKKPLSRFLRALSPSSQTLQTERRPLQFISKRTQADLPVARKASLARFLEKRKARVHRQEEALGPGGDANAANKKTNICDRPFPNSNMFVKLLMIDALKLQFSVLSSPKCIPPTLSPSVHPV
ncbi:hypothetical protein KP509_38G056200 [Ceratopteris richardii]|uniref:Uncharacterized protein n=1 Tax=Ceratopteris richardii TaxID=49495 RepID=A0A8T2Q566_CERRI|nr:hypothetical protein KP509_38G056200 [Ceratopteris richardii]KAH7278789.1 hypothetical protein KP509_38G056200 [Ceratopteris richardii]